MIMGTEKLYMDIRYTSRYMCIYDILAADNENDNGNGQRIIHGRRRMVMSITRKREKRIQLRKKNKTTKDGQSKMRR